MTGTTDGTLASRPCPELVADDGPAIPPADRDRAFETGYSTSESGTGFGLRIAREIVDAHGWDLSVTAAEGGGSRFDVRGVTVE